MNYTIIGAARSGLAAAELALDKGHEVFLTESKKAEDCGDYYEAVQALNIGNEFGGNTERALSGCNCIISSPGVPPSAWIIQEAERRNIPIISEIEFARQFCSENPLIAITGTNGKTTTTTLTAFIFNNSGREAIAAGNIGKPLSSLVKNLDRKTVIVAELSSYQLDRIDKFRPDAAIILNITPDHLGYHGTMDKYVEAKWKIFINQSEKNFLFLNGDDKILTGKLPPIPSQTAFFSLSPVDWGIYTENGKLKMKFPGKHKVEEIMLLDEIRLPGVHNIYNSMAAALAARAFEIRNEDIRDSLMSFQGVEHRLEYVDTINGIDFINDSKATNINATWYALSSYQQPIIWIAGGRGDSNDYGALDELVNSNVKCIVAIGEEADAIFNHYCTQVRCIKANSMDSAVAAAYSNADTNDVVLFTPACKSFDMFINYEHRGEVFKDSVNELKKAATVNGI